MKLNKEELIIASILTAIVVPFPLALVAIPICAFLWALSGSESKYNYKLWRRLGVPLVWAACLMNYYSLAAVPIAFGFLSMGYGIPDASDEGSWLGKIFKSDLIVRGIIYSGVLIPFLIVRFI